MKISMIQRVTMATALAVALTACGSSGPATISDGTYKFYAASENTTTSARLIVGGSNVVLTSDGTQTNYTTTESTEEYLLCPSDGMGTPYELNAPMIVGDLTLVIPAMFGDCGDGAPELVTVVDLDSATESGPIPFARWVEFCNVEEADC